MMKKLLYVLFACCLVYSCDSDDESIAAPSNVSNLSVQPRIGGAMLQWDLPADSSFTYVEVHYMKNEIEVVKKASKFTDTLLVDGLIHKEPLDFRVMTANETPGAKSSGEVKTTEEVTPIAREPEITFFANELTKLEVTNDMIDTYTQEASEGPKKNLLDDDKNTYWHSAWSSNTAPLPHWIQINFDSPQKLGAIKYWLRQGANDSGHPTQFGLEVSDDGENWERVWESKNDLSINDSEEHTLDFDINYESQYFRVMILKDGSGNFTYLGEISFYSMKSDIVDKEKEAEEEYYNFEL